MSPIPRVMSSAYQSQADISSQVETNWQLEGHTRHVGTSVLPQLCRTLNEFHTFEVSAVQLKLWICAEHFKPTNIPLKIKKIYKVANWELIRLKNRSLFYANRFFPSWKMSGNVLLFSKRIKFFLAKKKKKDLWLLLEEREVILHWVCTPADSQLGLSKSGLLRCLVYKWRSLPQSTPQPGCLHSVLSGWLCVYLCLLPLPPSNLFWDFLGTMLS